MEQVANKKAEDQTQALSNETRSPGKDLPIRGYFKSYDSPFKDLMVSVLTMRYLWLAVEDINPFNFLRKPHPKETLLSDLKKIFPQKSPEWLHKRVEASFKEWEKPDTIRYISRNFAALSIGATVMGILGFYTKRTHDDMRTLYAEAVGYELNKKPEDVTLKDLYFNSKNAALNVTRKAFIKRSLWRFGSTSAFFMPWHNMRGHPEVEPQWPANASAGVGIVGSYFSVEAFGRQPSFFDAEQNLASATINHINRSTDANIRKSITANNIHSLLVLQKKHLNKHYRMPDFSTDTGQKEMAMSQRIADLMNQTYHNTPKTEEADFTIGKFNYLVGFGLLDKAPSGLGFVELANRSSDMKEVKAAAAAIRSGKDAHSVFAGFGIDIDKILAQSAPAPVADAAPSVTKKFTDIVQPARDRIPQVQRSPQDFALETGNQHLAV